LFVRLQLPFHGAGGPGFSLLSWAAQLFSCPTGDRHPPSSLKHSCYNPPPFAPHLGTPHNIFPVPDKVPRVFLFRVFFSRGSCPPQLFCRNTSPSPPPGPLTFFFWQVLLFFFSSLPKTPSAAFFLSIHEFLICSPQTSRFSGIVPSPFVIQKKDFFSVIPGCFRCSPLVLSCLWSLLTIPLCQPPCFFHESQNVVAPFFFFSI